MPLAVPPVWPELAALDDAQYAEMLRHPAKRWLVATRGNMNAVVMVDESFLPAKARGANMGLIIDLAATTLSERQVRKSPGDPLPTEPVVIGGSYTLTDETRPIERLTLGHFKPVMTPAGNVVEAARLYLRDAATI